MKTARLQSAAARWLHQQWQTRGIWARLLWPLSCLVRCYVFAKGHWYRGDPKRAYRAPVPVVIVGNLYVGGVGKTPVVIALVKELLARGWNPGVISRGYGVKLGPSAHSGRGDLDPRAMGDEPTLISEQTHAPICVHPNRPLACKTLLTAYPEVDIIVSDDGLQHLALARDFEIVVQDQRRSGNGWLLPAGPLREPLSRLNTVDLVITRQAPPHPHSAAQTVQAPAELSTWLQISGVHSLDRKIKLSVNEFIKFQANKTVHAIAAISEPDRFFKSLREVSIRYHGSTGLPDHHPLDAAFFKTQPADLLLITAKDAVKCRALHDPRIWVVDTETVFSDPLWATKLFKQLPHFARSQPE